MLTAQLEKSRCASQVNLDPTFQEARNFHSNQQALSLPRFPLKDAVDGWAEGLHRSGAGLQLPQLSRFRALFCIAPGSGCYYFFNLQKRFKPDAIIEFEI